LEAVLVGLDGNREDVGVKSGLHGGDGVSGDVDVGGGLNNGGVGGVVLARSVSGGVWVGGLGLGVVGLEVLNSSVGPATIATVASGVAINELLLGEG